MTPTDRGEAPYVFQAASPATASPLVMGVRVAGAPSALAPRVREVAAAVDPGMRLRRLQPLDEVVWSSDARQLAGILSRALVLIGIGIVVGSALLMLFVTVADVEDVSLIVRELLITSPIIVTVGLLGCVAPARRALRISPTRR